MTWPCLRQFGQVTIGRFEKEIWEARAMASEEVIRFESEAIRRCSFSSKARMREDGYGVETEDSDKSRVMRDRR
jgi:hypothetical protein